MHINNSHIRLYKKTKGGENIYYFTIIFTQNNFVFSAYFLCSVCKGNLYALSVYETKNIIKTKYVSTTQLIDPAL
jgi:hypothetical protein